MVKYSVHCPESRVFGLKKLNVVLFASLFFLATFALTSSVQAQSQQGLVVDPTGSQLWQGRILWKGVDYYATETLSAVVNEKTDLVEINPGNVSLAYRFTKAIIVIDITNWKNMAGISPAN